MTIRVSSLIKYAVILSFMFLAGCAHNIQLTPDLNNLSKTEISDKIDKHVAYYISAENKAKEVTTPGGGGDKVKYKPYADSESALNTILSQAFSRVYSIDSVDNSAFIADKNISYIFVPEIVTDSSSSSAFTWPPTDFTINLTCKALDATGQTIWEKMIESKGHAEFSEFKADFSLSARRASEQAFTELLKAIDNESSFKK